MNERIKNYNIITVNLKNDPIPLFQIPNSIKYKIIQKWNYNIYDVKLDIVLT